MTTKETVYRGPKGVLHRQQQNPRLPKTINWLEVFTNNHCGGSVEERDRLLNRFKLLNNNATKKEANGMLSVFIEQGAKETLLREVFRIGGGRYSKLFGGRRCLLNKRL